MVDSRPLNDQLREFQNFIRHLQFKGNTFTENYKVSNIIDKLPPLWSNFAGNLRYKQGNLTLIEALRKIKAEDKLRHNSELSSELKAKVNLVEEKSKNSKKPEELQT